jgi:hypothetical protein
VTLLFGAIDGAEKRKGFAELTDAMKTCRENEAFQELLRKNQVRLLCFGSPNDQLESMGIPVVSLGRLGSDEDIRDAYSAADIFLLPSLEDNLPNTILESMSCGTPVVAFHVGGVPDMITDGVNGLLVKAFDTQKMGEAIVSLLVDPEKRSAMGKACRERAIRDYALDVQAGNYLKLYDDLLHEDQPSTTDTNGRAKSADGMGNDVAIPLAPTPGYLNITLGPRMGAVYDDLLFHTLKTFTPHVYEQWNMSELDRLKRLNQVERLTRLLEASESDRGARLEQVNELITLLEACEEDRAARLNVIETLESRLDSKKIRKELDECHAEMERLAQRTLVAERSWQALESTQVVRKARRVGFIKLEKPDFSKNDKDEK